MQRSHALGAHTVRHPGGGIVLTTLAALLVVVAMPLLSAPAEAATHWRCGDAHWVSHRGLVDHRRVENTVSAFRHAYARGARTIETDTWETRDHQWAIMHDPTVNRTTRGTGKVSAMTLAQVQALRTNDGTRGGVPSLSQALYFLRSNPSLRMEIEIKSLAASDRALALLTRQISNYGVAGRVRISSFGRTVLDRVHAVDPMLARVLITGHRLSADQVLPHATTVALNLGVATSAYVAALRAKGIVVEVWTVDHRPGWARAVSVHANNVITDAGPAFQRYCRHGR